MSREVRPGHVNDLCGEVPAVLQHADGIGQPGFGRGVPFVRDVLVEAKPLAVFKYRTVKAIPDSVEPGEPDVIQKEFHIRGKMTYKSRTEWGAFREVLAVKRDCIQIKLKLYGTIFHPFPDVFHDLQEAVRVEKIPHGVSIFRKLFNPVCSTPRAVSA